MRKERAEMKNFKRSNSKKISSWSYFGVLILMLLIGTFPAAAHCDSYDGPVIKDAEKALETNEVSLVFKWINREQEQKISDLFKKTYELKTGDKEVFKIVKKHFFETLVRLHRETEGALYTGLKPKGETKEIIQLSDLALASKNVEDLIEKFNAHLAKVIRTKYEKVASLDQVKNDSVEKGREYVEAYVEYTHTLEAIHDIMEHGGGHAEHKE